MSQARQIAFDVLVEVERGENASDTLDRALYGVDSREAGLATELVFGTLRRRAQLLHLIQQVSSRRTTEMDSTVRIAMELGAYQLRFLDRIPPHAAVSESVDLAKRARRPHAAPMVNAVLRRLPQLPLRWDDAALRYSLPAWLWRRWIRAHGVEAAQALGAASLVQPAAYVRVPPGTTPLENCEPTSVPGCFRVTGAPPPGLRRQDIGAQAVVPLLELAPGQLLLDLCAAPGNKTAQALETPGVRVISCDASPSRLRTLWVSNANLVRLDAAEPLPFGPLFDRILVDAPCSGTGTLARNPELRWRLREADLKRHARRQRWILRRALDVLKPGGRLVYSTCSLEPEENSEVVRDIAPERVVWETLRLPGRDEGDGFYAAVLT